MIKNDGAADISSLVSMQWRITVLEEQAQIREHKLALAVSYDSAKVARIRQLEAELADWRKLRDPEHLCAQLFNDIPARLELRHVEQLLLARMDRNTSITGAAQ